MLLVDQRIIRLDFEWCKCRIQGQSPALTLISMLTGEIRYSTWHDATIRILVCPGQQEFVSQEFRFTSYSAATIAKNAFDKGVITSGTWAALPSQQNNMMRRYTRTF